MTMRKAASVIALFLSSAALQPVAAQPVTAISQSDKAQGAEANPQLLREFGGAYVGPQADYVRRVGQRIAVQSGLSNAQSDFTVTLLNSPVNNAFAIPGGYVYVTRQLLALMNDEAELASVMGHEVGHVAARHSRSRSTTSTLAGAAAAIFGAMVGNSTLGALASRGAGTLATLYTLNFSRAQENQADDLSVSYLTRAGYDPMASSTMLASLAAQSALDARLGGRTSSTPTIFSTHPDPAGRVARTAAAARSTGKAGVRNRDAFLAAIDGMIYGDDPAQGIVEGQEFRHPALRLAFTAPAGFTMTNAPEAVTVSGSGGQAQFMGLPYAGDPDAYVASAFNAVAPQAQLAFGSIARTKINGIDVASAVARANTQSGPVDVAVTAYFLGPKTAFHFVTIAAAGSGTGPFAGLVRSLRRLTDAQVAAIRPRRVKVVTLGPADTLASLAARMAYTDTREDRFRVLNALPAGWSPRPGQKVKLIVFG